jgi:hypothetical protein
MSTSDNISSQDWEAVHECVLRIVNSSEDESGPQYPKDLSALLDTLHRLSIKYGPKPSIIATLGDFTESIAMKALLYQSAYQLATIEGDAANQFMIALDLAEMYMEDWKDHELAFSWLKKAQTSKTDDIDDLAKLDELERLLGG